jgi:glycine/D-amino acid oxidase-like deaminating enzyme
MQHYGIKFYADMASSDTKTGFVPSGIAYIYRSPEAWRKVQPRIEEARRLGTRLEILTAKRTAEVLPQIEFRRVAGIAFDPDSVRVRAADMIPALARQAAAKGVRFEYSTAVRELRPGGVRTDRGDYFAKSVIVTAGAWTRPLLERAGKSCPSNPIAEIRYTTKPIAEIQPNLPLLIFSDYGFYIREEFGGLLIGGGDPHPAPKDREIDPANPRLADKLRTDQAYRVRKHIREIEDMMPVLKLAEIDRIAGGIPTFTADTQFIADAVPGQSGLYAMSACQEAGITHGPGLGLMMSELVTRGDTTWDRSRYRLSRFGGMTEHT